MEDPRELERFAQARRRFSLLLTVIMLTVYFGFILLGAYAKQFMGQTIVPGISYGILLGALVIVIAFALTGIYVHWANRHDVTLDAERSKDGS
jgi:uncharacterized membrane protein (DUF485 family)